MLVTVNREKEIELDEGFSVKDLVEKLRLTAPEQAVAVSINGTLKDLDAPLQEGDDVQFWNFDDPEGKEVFWHTSAHLLAQAILRIWPDAKPATGPPIENGFYYDFADLDISEHDFLAIEQEVEKIIQENPKLEREVFRGKEEALKAFSNNPYKNELIESFEDETISAYRQGEFFDLCRGPHLPDLGKIKAFKILKTSGAYWRGDPDREMLTRVYAISFPDKKSLKLHLVRLEEAKKRDHKILGPKLNLFSFAEESPGMPFIHHKGMMIWTKLTDYLRHTLLDAGYIEIKTPMMLTKELWERSGHWEHYREHMYLSIIEDREYAIKPMNCPGCMLYYGEAVRSYRELPLRIAEIGHVHRFEPSGALNGLFRVRSFHQDDAHLFMKKENIQSEMTQLLELADEIYGAFGLAYVLELSTRPEKSKTIGSDEDWEAATKGLRKALEKKGLPYKINEGDGAFYGPKVDIHIRDAIGRLWQCGTVQLDLSLPEKFELEYVDSDGVYKRPIMIHRALFGSIERFFGILIEHFSGKFPLWLSPYPVRILPVADRHIEYCRKLEKKIRSEGISIDIDDSSESVSKKVRNAQILKYNYMIMIGDKEVKNHSLSLRARNNVVHREMKISRFLDEIIKERDTKALISPFLTSK